MENKIRTIFSVLVIATVLVIGTVFPGMAVLGESEQEREEVSIVLVQTEDSEEVEELKEHGDIIDHYGQNILIETSQVEVLEKDYHVDHLEHRNEIFLSG